MSVDASVYSQPRIFHLVRDKHAPEPNGSEIVAEGVQWSDGAVAVRFHGDLPAVVTYETGIRAVIAIHGKAQATSVRWQDDVSSLHPRSVLGEDFSPPQFFDAGG